MKTMPVKFEVFGVGDVVKHNSWGKGIVTEDEKCRENYGSRNVYRSVMVLFGNGKNPVKTVPSNLTLVKEVPK